MQRRAQQPPVVGQGAGATKPTSKWSFILENRLAMFGMLFGVTGFLGIPFLWMSHRFSRREKMVWSVIVTIYTLLLIAGMLAICWWSYTQITRSLAGEMPWRYPTGQASAYSRAEALAISTATDQAALRLPNREEESTWKIFREDGMACEASCCLACANRI